MIFKGVKNEFELKPEKIATHASLLCSDPKKLRRNVSILKDEFGLKPKAIATCATLLYRDPDMLRRNASILKDEFELQPKSIATCATAIIYVSIATRIEICFTPICTFRRFQQWTNKDIILFIRPLNK